MTDQRAAQERGADICARHQGLIEAHDHALAVDRGRARQLRGHGAGNELAGNELADGIDRDRRAEQEGRGAEPLRIERQQRQDDSHSRGVHGDDDEGRDERQRALARYRLPCLSRGTRSHAALSWFAFA